MKRHIHLLIFTVLVLMAGGGPSVAHASGPWNGHAVAFTFTSDDGDRTSNSAWSTLFTARGLSYTVFIPSTWVGMNISKLTASDLRNLYSRGIEVGSHGRTHVRLTDVNDAQLIDELVGSCQDLESFIQNSGYRCRTIGYPDHAHDLHVMAVAESLGFTAARDGGGSSAGYPNFSQGGATWSATSLFEPPVTVVDSYLVGSNNSYTEAQTRAQVQALLAITLPQNLWINIYAHTLNDIDVPHMTWILDELGKGDVWIDNFGKVADFYRTGHGLKIPQGVGKPVPVILSRFAAVSGSKGIQLSWTASGDLDFAGIYVERSQERQGDYVRLNSVLLPPGETGKYIDATVKPGIIYFYKLEFLSRTGTSSFFGPVTASLHSERLEPGPILGMAEPNPSRNGRSTIPFSLPQSSEVTLRILNLTGRSVKTLVAEGMDAGNHAVSWDGRDAYGQGVPSGLYLYQLEALGVEATRKLFWLE